MVGDKNEFRIRVTDKWSIVPEGVRSYRILKDDETECWRNTLDEAAETIAIEIIKADCEVLSLGEYLSEIKNIKMEFIGGLSEYD